MLLESAPIGDSTGRVAGRRLLAKMYKDHTGQDLPPILTTDRGKPYFADSPLHFSISHTKKRVFCALSEDPVGIDAEALDRNIRPELADKILSPEERRQYDAAQDRRLALLTFWVLKEARAKFTGQGLQGYPNHTDFRLNDPRVTTREGCLVAVIQEDAYVI